MEDFYKILCEKINADDADFDIELNRDHDIFKGHFPGEPITPGVCIVKTALELANIAFKNKYQIKTAKNIKFLNIISPVDNPFVSFK
ncbi:MAG: hydroxymyristoyl-ACP dehydratase, partial [Bacteroidales bacterium]|nr:hydroxymyristoyl-ACP dehydratase [Bacteroidales bacterium]